MTDHDPELERPPLPKGDGRLPTDPDEFDALIFRTLEPWRDLIRSEVLTSAEVLEAMTEMAESERDVEGGQDTVEGP